MPVRRSNLAAVAALATGASCAAPHDAPPLIAAAENGDRGAVRAHVHNQEAFVSSNLAARRGRRDRVAVVRFDDPCAHGATMDKWTPAATGKRFALSEILAPLEPFKDDVCIVSGLAHAPVAPWTGEDTGSAENHVRAAAVFLSGAHPVKGDRARRWRI
jgi:hypothetical protein